MFGVVVLDEGDGILLVVVIGREWLFVVTQPTPVGIVDGIANPITELEVESSTGWCVGDIATRIVHPFANFCTTVPILAYAESRLCITIIVGNEIGVKAFHHIVAKACVANIFEKEFEISLYAVLYVRAQVVDVATTGPVFACVVVLRKRNALAVCPVICLSAIVVTADVGRQHLVGMPLVGLGRIVHPRATSTHVVAMVDDNIGNDACASFAKGSYHAPELRF